MKLLLAMETAFVVVWAIAIMLFVPVARAFKRKETFNDSRTRRF